MEKAELRLRYRRCFRMNSGFEREAADRRQQNAVDDVPARMVEHPRCGMLDQDNDRARS